jgi:hypothetical protein
MTRIALIARQMLNHEQCGLKRVCLDAAEGKLLQASETLPINYESTPESNGLGLRKAA